MNYITLYKTLLGTIVLLALSFISISQNAYANTVTNAQDIAIIKLKVEEYLKTQTLGAPGKVGISVGAIDKYIKLENCVAMEAFLPTGSRAWGKTTVGVRCGAPSPWTIYVQAKVAVYADYIATAKPLAQGQHISQQDIVMQQGDLTSLPPGIVTNPSEAIGLSLTSSIPAGAVLRRDLLRSPMVISTGQTVRLISTGKGFSVSAEAQALANANEGQVVKAKTSNGIVVSGIARQGGNIMVSY